MSHPALSRADGVRTRLIAIAVAVLVMFALRATRSVSMPLVLGLTFAVLAWPVQHWVAARAPRALGILAAVLSIVVVMGGIIALLSWSGNLLAERARRDEARIASLHQRASAMAARIGISLPGGSRGGAAEGGSGGGGSSGADSAATGESGRQGGSGGGLGARIGGAVLGSLTSLALAIGFGALALAEIDAVRARVRARFDEAKAERLLEAGSEITHTVRHYFLAKSVTSLITGTATLLLTLAFGLDLAWIWGMLAFLLEYVPSIGSLIAVIPPTLFAFVQFDGLTKPLALAVALTVMQLILGNFVDPKIEGRFMSVSPLVVLLSIVFWAWVWGPFGALLGVPITVTLMLLARRFPGTWWAWAILTEQEKEERKAQERQAQEHEPNRPAARG